MFSSWNRHTYASTPSKIILIVGKEAHQGNREETKRAVVATEKWFEDSTPVLLGQRLASHLPEAPDQIRDSWLD